MARLLTVIFQSGFSFRLSEAEYLDLGELKIICEKKGLECKQNKNLLNVKLDGVSFNVYKGGKIGRCYSSNLEALSSFDEQVADFFWRNFAVYCVKKKEEF